MDDVVRLDRWLWAARFFRTRPLAAEAVAGGRVEVAGGRAKPGRRVRVGEELTITRGSERVSVVIAAISERRGPASEAQALYEETPESVARREEEREKARVEHSARSGPRPTKRDRRRLERDRGRRRR
jgi:ribosome-associated heat shock protein Hsp15